MPNEATFTLKFLTKSDLGGINEFFSGVQSGLQKVADFSNRVNGALQAFAGYLSVQALKTYARDAEQANLAQAKLQRALENSGQATNEYRAELDAAAKSLQAITGIDDDVITAAQGTLVGFGVQRDQIRELTALTLDFAEFMGTDASSAAELLGRALLGEEIQLRGVRLEIDKDLPKHEQLAQLMTQLGAIVGGQAEAANKATGGMRAYRTELKNIQEDIGQLVLKVEVPFMRGFAEQLRGVADSLTNLRSRFPGLFTELDRAMVSLGQFGAVVGPVLIGLTALTGVVRVLTSSLGPLRNAVILAAGAWAGWTFGKWLSDVQIADATVNQHLQRMVYGAQHAFNEIDRWIMTISRAIAFGALKIFSAGYTQIREFASKIADVLGQVNPVAAWGLKKAIGLSDWMGLPSPEEIDAQRDKSIAAINKAHDETKEQILANAAELEREIKGEASKEEIPVITVSKIGRAPASASAGDSAAAKTASDTDALTQAKDRLSVAEEFYQTQIERTRLLEEAGTISSEQGAEMRRQASQNYLEQLRELIPVLELLIAQETALGHTDAANQLIVELEKLRNKTIEVGNEMGSETFFGKMRSQLTQLQKEWTDLGKQIGGFLVQQFQNLASTAGNVIGNLIRGTFNWRTTLVDLFASFASGLVTMIAQWVLARTVISLLNRIFGNTDAQIVNQQASQAAAAWAPAATAASIASYGAAAGFGLAAFLAAIGVGTAGAVAAAGVGGAGFEVGGYTGGVEGRVAGLVHGREFVFNAAATRAIGPDVLKALHEGALFTRPAGAASGGAGSSGGSPGGISGGRSSEIHIYNFTDKRALFEAYRNDSESEKHIIETVQRNSFQLPFPR